MTMSRLWRRVVCLPSVIRTIRGLGVGVMRRPAQACVVRCSSTHNDNCLSDHHITIPTSSMPDADLAKHLDDLPGLRTSHDPVAVEAFINQLPSLTPKETQAAISQLSASEVLAVVRMSHQNLTKEVARDLLSRLEYIGRELVAEEDTVLRGAFEDEGMAVDDLRKDIVTCDDYTSALNQSYGFQLLCVLVAKKGRYYDPSSATRLVHILSNLGVSSDRVVMKIFLQLSLHHINHLYLKELIRVAYVVSELTQTDQTSLLLRAIGTLSVTRWKEMYACTTWELITLFEVCGAYFNKMATKTLMSKLQQADSLHWQQCLVLFDAMATHNVNIPKLERICLNVMWNKVDNLSNEEILSVLEKSLSKKMYSADWCSFAAERHLKDDTKIADKIKLLMLLHKFSHFEAEFSCSVLTKDCEDLSSVLTEIDASDLLNVCQYFAQGIYLLPAVTKWLPVVKDLMHEVSLKVEELSIEDELELLVYEAIFDFQNVKVSNFASSLSQSTNICDVVKSVAEDRNMAAKLQLLRMSMMSRGLQDSDLYRTLESCSCSLSTRVLEGSVECAAGHDRVIHEYKHPDTGVVINHLCAVDAQGNFLEIEKVPENVLDTDIRWVAVLEFPDSCFYRNAGDLKAYARSQAHALQQCGFQVLVYNSDKWLESGSLARLEQLQYQLKHPELYQNLDLVKINPLLM